MSKGGRDGCALVRCVCTCKLSMHACVGLESDSMRDHSQNHAGSGFTFNRNKNKPNTKISISVKGVKLSSWKPLSSKSLASTLFKHNY